MTNYYFSPRTSSIVCIITVKKEGCFREQNSFKGVAKCSPNDVFDEAKGREIAYVRALLKLKKKEAQYHKEEMKWDQAEYNNYMRNKKAYEYNQKRVKEVQAELDTLLQ